MVSHQLYLNDTSYLQTLLIWYFVIQIPFGPTVNWIKSSFSNKHKLQNRTKHCHLPERWCEKCMTLSFLSICLLLLSFIAQCSLHPSPVSPLLFRCLTSLNLLQHLSFIPGLLCSLSVPSCPLLPRCLLSVHSSPLLLLHQTLLPVLPQPHHISTLNISLFILPSASFVWLQLLHIRSSPTIIPYKNRCLFGSHSAVYIDVSK